MPTQDTDICVPFPVTRTNKANNRDYKGLAEGTAHPSEHLPRFFAKSGYADVDPKKIKKDGCGRGNWYAPFKIPISSNDMLTYCSGVHLETTLQTNNSALPTLGAAPTAAPSPTILVT